MSDPGQDQRTALLAQTIFDATPPTRTSTGEAVQINHSMWRADTRAYFMNLASLSEPLDSARTNAEQIGA